MPFVWSDQYDRKIQTVGHFRRRRRRWQVVHGSLEERRFVAIFGRGGRLVGALGFYQPCQGHAVSQDDRGARRRSRMHSSSSPRREAPAHRRTRPSPTAAAHPALRGRDDLGLLLLHRDGRDAAGDPAVRRGSAGRRRHRSRHRGGRVRGRRDPAAAYRRSGRRSLRPARADHRRCVHRRRHGTLRGARRGARVADRDPRDHGPGRGLLLRGRHDDGDGPRARGAARGGGELLVRRAVEAGSRSVRCSASCC